MTADYQSILSRQHSIEQVVPLLEAIRSVAEIAFRHAERQLQPLADYSRRLHGQLQQAGGVVGSHLDVTGGNVMLVAITSERGLCGNFNRSLVGSTVDLIERLKADGEEVELVCLGTQGKRLFAVHHLDLAFWSPTPSFAAPSYPDVEALVLQILDLMDQRGCSRLLVIHNAPVHRFQHEVVSSQLFPFEWSESQPRPQAAIKPAEDVSALVTHLITERVLIDLYEAIILSSTSEELARVAAMKLATDNARKRLDELSVAANQARQFAETNALLEIISGFEAASYIASANRQDQ